MERHTEDQIQNGEWQDPSREGHAGGGGIPGDIVDDIFNEDSATTKRIVAKNMPCFNIPHKPLSSVPRANFGGGYGQILNPHRGSAEDLTPDLSANALRCCPLRLERQPIELLHTSVL
jgi:hypothetical protein